ncbi:MAG: PRTRC system ThiF family protein [Cyclobacteriaceae bacterium]
MNSHPTHPYLLNPLHPVKIVLIGCGGTGSHMLSALCRLHQGLVALGHVGLHVTVYDNDTVSESNVGRQLFSLADLGMNKAICLVTRINRHAGTDWLAVPHFYDPVERSGDSCNIIITCVDNIKTRLRVKNVIGRERKVSQDIHPGLTYYWLDLGNSRYTGQVVLGSVTGRKTNPVPVLEDIVDLHPELKHMTGEEDPSPSCSMFEALSKQDLFINSSLAQLAGNLLWRLFTNARLTYHGFYVNLETMRTTPLLIEKKPEEMKKKGRRTTKVSR